MSDDITGIILALEERRCTAMRGNDIQALDDLLDPELYFCHANGAVDDKPAYLAKMSQARIVYRQIDWSERVVTVVGDIAILTGRMVSQVLVNGIDKRLDNRVLAIWAGRSDLWRLRCFQPTPLPQG